MKTAIFSNELGKKLRAMKRKTRSHGSCRAKRKPNSPRVRVDTHTNAQYVVVK